jgi:hypothetical protein
VLISFKTTSRASPMVKNGIANDLANEKAFDLANETFKN